MHFVWDNRDKVHLSRLVHLNRVPTNKLGYIGKRFLHRKSAYRNRQRESLIALAFQLLVALPSDIIG